MSEENKNHIVSEFCNLYGLDVHDENLTAAQVRDALVKCFVSAHGEILESLKEYGSFSSNEEFEKFKGIDAELLIRNFFKEAGGDYEQPDKKSLLAVVDKLAEYSKNFRSEEIIRKHSGQIKVFINKL